MCSSLARFNSVVPVSIVFYAGSAIPGGVYYYTMAKAMSLHSALINIVNSRHGQLFGNCCLCLKTTKSDALRLQDEIIVNESLTSQSLLEILVFILGDEIGNALSLEDMLCDLCKLMVMKCYTFIKSCKETIDCLQNAVNSLADGLTKSTEDFTAYKSLFVTLNTSDCTTTLYYDNKRPVGYRPSLVKRLQILMQGEQKRRRKENSLNDDFGTACYDSEPDIKQEINTKLTENTITTDNITKVDAKPQILQKHEKQNTIKKKTKSTATISTKDMMYGKEDMRCKICLQRFTVSKNLRQHYLRVHAAKEFKCFNCPRRYGSKPLLAEHMLLSHTPSVCSVCGKSYSKRSSLKQHEAVHKFKIMCPKCGKSYKTPGTFRSHSCGCHRNRGTLENNPDVVQLAKKYTCDYCDKKYVRKSTIRTHIQLEHGDGKAHICRWCNKKFAALSTLNRHIVTHTQEKNFGCELCGGKFVSKASLLYHTRTHTGEKPYECKVCQMKFLSVSRRSEHERRTHSSIIHECNICHNKFKSRSCLRRHQNRHLNPSSKLHFKPSEEKVDECVLHTN